MIRSASAAASGGQIPRCWGFRLRPRPVAGAAVVAPPFPVKVRDTSTHQNEFLVFDSSWYERRGRMLGPWVIDPDGELAGWAWDVTWTDEEGEKVDPVDLATEGVLLYDSGTVAAGAAIQTPVLNVRRYTHILACVLNGDAAARSFQWQIPASAGAATLTAQWISVAGGAQVMGGWGPGSTAGGVVAFGFQAALPPEIAFVLVAGAGGNGRVTIFAR